MKSLFVLFLGLTMTNLASEQPQTSPEMVFINGDICPGVISALRKSGTLSESSVLVNKRVQAIAVSGGKIIAVGTNDEIQKLKGPKTQVIDLGGHFVMPGFNDAHTHLASGGFEKLNVDLVGTKSLQEMQQRIAARAKTAASGEWLVGRGWDHTLWTEQKTPTRQDIDSASGDHPAIFTRVDGHIAIANTAALQAAGITAP